ncbi:MAG: PhzF family phenazine biosynthesis protein [Actinobacteria bacterium]|nr:PhzF family phenazine biosynthesis protein [Actinomycetota bacterium]
MRRRFAEVDVFTEVPYRGNPLAVVIDGDGLTDDEMQRFANWTNFSETTFVLPPTSADADYRVRIFTTSTELPFAGHPTIGTCHAWLEAGGTPTSPGAVVQECGVGLVRIDRGDRLAFAAPPLLRGGPLDLDTLAEAARALGVPPDAIVDSAWIDNGPGWAGILLRSADDVLAIDVANTALKLGVIGPYPDGHDFAYEVRGFFPDGAITFEDPVTGSLNASAAQWLIESGRVTAPYVASQGARLGRAGRVHIATDPSGQVWVGGDAVTCVAGTVEL